MYVYTLHRDRSEKALGADESFLPEYIWWNIYGDYDDRYSVQTTHASCWCCECTVPEMDRGGEGGRIYTDSRRFPVWRSVRRRRAGGRIVRVLQDERTADSGFYPRSQSRKCKDKWQTVTDDDAVVSPKTATAKTYIYLSAARGRGRAVEKKQHRNTYTRMKIKMAFGSFLYSNTTQGGG